MYIVIALLQETTVLDLKKKILAKIPLAIVFLQRLALQDKTVLDQDGQKLTSYTGLRDGAVIFLIIRTPFKLYIQDSLGKLHEITIPSQTPEVNTCDEYHWFWVLTNLKSLIKFHDVIHSSTTAQRITVCNNILK